MSDYRKRGIYASGDRADKPTERVGSYLTVPQFHRLSWACEPIRKAFLSPPYLVGSVLQRPDFHDVDLRLLMCYPRGGTDFQVEGAQRLLLGCVISDWLAAATGLPIDFQFQTEAEWDAETGPRNPMGV